MAVVRISVVIPTLNEEANIGSILSDLNAQTLKPIEVLVVDANSTDQTRTIAKKLGASVTLGNSPVGAQRQFGVSKAKGELIFLLDADTRIKPDFIENVANHFLQINLKIGCPYYLPKPGGVLITPVYCFFNLMFFFFQLVTASGAGSCIVFTKKVWKESGGFKAEYKFDDIEFIRRASRFGKFRMLPFAVQVSDRRFRRQGVVRTTLDYLMLSLIFTLGLFGLANFYSYQFGHYEKKSPSTKSS